MVSKGVDTMRFVLSGLNGVIQKTARGKRREYVSGFFR